MDIINCNRIEKTYKNGKEALRDIEMCIRQGERVGLIGPMGAGKTTLLRVLAGALDSTSGILQIGVEKKETAYMPASNGLIRTLTVRDNIKIWRNAFGASSENVDYIIENDGYVCNAEEVADEIIEILYKRRKETVDE